MKRSWLVGLLTGAALLLMAGLPVHAQQSQTDEAASDVSAEVETDQAQPDDQESSSTRQSGATAQSEVDADAEATIQRERATDRSQRSTTRQRDASQQRRSDVDRARRDRGQAGADARLRAQGQGRADLRDQRDRLELDAEGEANAQLRGQADTQFRGQADTELRGEADTRLRGQLEQDRDAQQSRRRFDQELDQRSRQDRFDERDRFQDQRRSRDLDVQAEGQIEAEGEFEAEGRSDLRARTSSAFQLEDRLGLSFSTTAQDRLVVSQIIDDSLAARVGFQRGDVLLAVDGRRVYSPAEFYRIIDIAGPDDRVQLVVLRDGVREVLFVDTADLVARQTYRQRRYYPQDTYRVRGTAWLGVYLDERYRHAVVDSVEPGSPADRAGLDQGDWILAINGRSVQSADHLSSIVRQMEPGQEVDIRISRRQDTVVSTRLASRPDPRRSYRDQERVYDDDFYTGGRSYDAQAGFVDEYDVYDYELRDERLLEPDRFDADVEFDPRTGTRVDTRNRLFDRDRGLLDRIRDRRD